MTMFHRTSDIDLASQSLEAEMTAHRPQEEGAFDSGVHQIFEGQVLVGPNRVDWRLDLPENRQYDGMATFVPGYSGIHGSSTRPQTALAAEGIATVTYSPARINDDSWWESATNPQGLHVRAMRAVQANVRDRLDIRRATPEATNFDHTKQLLITHSMGGLAAAHFADEEPGSVDAILHLAACGFGSPTLGNLILDVPKGALLGVRHELLPSLLGGEIEPTIKNLRDMCNYFRRVQAIFEAHSCLREDVRPLTEKARAAGIFVAYQAYEFDILVRPNPDVADHVDHHEVMARTGHLGPIRRGPAVAQRAAFIINNRTPQPV